MSVILLWYSSLLRPFLLFSTIGMISINITNIIHYLHSNELYLSSNTRHLSPKYRVLVKCVGRGLCSFDGWVTKTAPILTTQIQASHYQWLIMHNCQITQQQIPKSNLQRIAPCRHTTAFSLAVVTWGLGVGDCPKSKQPLREQTDIRTPKDNKIWQWQIGCYKSDRKVVNLFFFNLKSELHIFFYKETAGENNWRTLVHPNLRTLTLENEWSYWTGCMRKLSTWGHC